jgi:hypothetical protein
MKFIRTTNGFSFIYRYIIIYIVIIYIRNLFFWVDSALSGKMNLNRKPDFRDLYSARMAGSRF